MTTASFSLEFQLNISEVKKLNKMYFKHLLRERIVYCFLAVLMFVIFVDYTVETDFFDWLLRSLFLVVAFVIIQFSFIDIISKTVFKWIKKLMRLDKFPNRYKLTFTYSDICVKSPLGELTHKWSKIEKVILTKNFLFFYVKEQNSYIISISKKDSDSRKIDELLSFVEKNVIPIIKV
ncbi:YcxB family protein [Flavobacterium quisquiliarum]|uniref:YcxB family protein n=1 Tax=Flavobacterium quisquiliarum TaxID=1834436 RepID=A0ABV8W3V3_9FLAO|nr:YcxB family protein [Flavobacterium quisquiliarum]MBW1655382.1 hypothetical protein [Flavobacterium quisquiliarum]NWL03006.1 hypothetical protein [Flavobacterium collinsii]